MSHHGHNRRRRYRATAAEAPAAGRSPPGEGRMTRPPECASRLGHAFAATGLYGAVTTHPELPHSSADGGGGACTSTSYEADEHCTRRGCHATRHTDARPASRDADGVPSYTYGVLPPAAGREKNREQSLVRPDRMVRRRANGHIGAKPPGGRDAGGGGGGENPGGRRRGGRKRRRDGGGAPPHEARQARM